MRPSITDFQLLDAKKMLALYESQGHCFEDIGVSEEFILHCAQRPDFKFLIAKNADELIGFTGCLLFENVGRAEFGPIAVLEGSQGMGVGTLLESSMRKHLIARGITRLTVKVKSGNRPALRFFMGQGYVVEVVLTAYTSAKEDVVQLVVHIG